MEKYKEQFKSRNASFVIGEDRSCPDFGTPGRGGALKKNYRNIGGDFLFLRAVGEVSFFLNEQ